MLKSCHASRNFCFADGPRAGRLADHAQRPGHAARKTRNRAADHHKTSDAGDATRKARDADDKAGHTRFNRPGLLAMANTGSPNTGGGQFFITVAPYPAGNGGYTVFGEIIAGQENVTAISEVPRGMSGPAKDRPLTPVTLRSVTIETVK